MTQRIRCHDPCLHHAHWKAHAANRMKVARSVAWMSKLTVYANTHQNVIQILPHVTREERVCKDLFNDIPHNQHTHTHILVDCPSSTKTCFTFQPTTTTVTSTVRWKRTYARRRQSTNVGPSSSVTKKIDMSTRNKCYAFKKYIHIRAVN